MGPLVSWAQREKVLGYIRQERGGMFDPRIVDLFFEHLDALEAIKDRLSDPAAFPGGHDLAAPVACPAELG